MNVGLNNVLIVDLDGTLLKSDMLHESFWSAFSRNWFIPFLSLLALIKGKASLKSYLCSEAHVDISSLPFDDKVVAYVRAHREKGFFHGLSNGI